MTDDQNKNLKSIFDDDDDDFASANTPEEKIPEPSPEEKIPEDNFDIDDLFDSDDSITEVSKEEDKAEEQKEAMDDLFTELPASEFTAPIETHANSSEAEDELKKEEDIESLLEEADDDEIVKLIEQQLEESLKDKEELNEKDEELIQKVQESNKAAKAAKTFLDSYAGEGPVSDGPDGLYTLEEIAQGTGANEDDDIFEIVEGPANDSKNSEENLTDEDDLPDSDLEDSKEEEVEDEGPKQNFKALANYDYNENSLANEIQEGAEEEKPSINRNLAILLTAIFLVGGWTMYNTLFNRKYEQTASRRKRRPRKEKRSLRDATIAQRPLWDLTSQSAGDYFKQLEMVRDIYDAAGRPNPFSFPESVLLKMRQQAEAELLAKKKPDTYKKKAYRATLIGVLQSKQKVIALVNLQEASFDIVEGTTKNKIIKLATKAMTRSKKQTMELFKGSFIGPWFIKDITPPELGLTDPKMILVKEDETKVLVLNKPEELGIFDEEGMLDNLEPKSSSDEKDDQDTEA